MSHKNSFVYIVHGKGHQPWKLNTVKFPGWNVFSMKYLWSMVGQIMSFSHHNNKNKKVSSYWLQSILLIIIIQESKLSSLIIMSWLKMSRFNTFHGRCHIPFPHPTLLRAALLTTGSPSKLHAVWNPLYIEQVIDYRPCLFIRSNKAHTRRNRCSN